MKKGYAGLAVGLVLSMSGSAWANADVLKEKNTESKVQLIEGSSKAGEETKDREAKSVAEQLQAPEYYRTELSGQAPPDAEDETAGSEMEEAQHDSESRAEETLSVSDSEKLAAQIEVTVDAKVNVPKTEKICLKKVTCFTGKEALDITSKLMDAFPLDSGSELIDTSETEIEDYGRIEEKIIKAGELFYDVHSSVAMESPNGETKKIKAMSFYYYLDTERLPEIAGRTKTLEELAGADEAADSVEAQKKALMKIFRKLGINDLEFGRQSSDKVSLSDKNGNEIPVDFNLYHMKRLVDSVPVTLVCDGNEYPIYPLAVDIETQSMTENNWNMEAFTASFYNGVLRGFNWSFPMKISDYSDEGEFLLPFEEIKTIFENTVTAKTGTVSELNVEQYAGPEKTRYGTYGYRLEEMKNVKIKIDRIDLGYMRVRIDERDNSEGLLIPVWDFFGSWEGEIQNEDGSVEKVVMDTDDLSLLTLDARDGSVIERMRGY
ncbi:MAG: DUF6034 family protein [Lachnospiraceae bacterium]|nr:DUF6034 family protein [Lachnospiraceae bacterium]